jgi:hypothetical protein
MFRSCKVTTDGNIEYQLKMEEALTDFNNI